MTLKRQAFNGCLDGVGDDSTRSNISTRLADQCCQAERAILGHPSLSGPERDTRLCRYNTKRHILFEVRLEPTEARESSFAVCFRKFEEFRHVLSLPQIALKYLRQIMVLPHIW